MNYESSNLLLNKILDKKEKSGATILAPDINGSGFEYIFRN